MSSSRDQVASPTLSSWRAWRLGGSFSGSPLLRALRRWKMLALGLAIVAFFVAAALAADLIRPYSTATRQNVAERLQAPSAAHPFGTDDFGRDLFSRVLHGSRITLLVALAAVGISTPIGVPIGLTIGYLGGACEAVVSRLLDALL